MCETTTQSVAVVHERSTAKAIWQAAAPLVPPVPVGPPSSVKDPDPQAASNSASQPTPWITHRWFVVIAVGPSIAHAICDCEIRAAFGGASSEN